MAEISPDAEPARRLSRSYRLIVGTLVGVSAVVTFFLLGIGQNEIKITVFVGLGGRLSGYFLAVGFGRSDLRGWIIALITYLGCTIAGGALGGLFTGLPVGPLGGLVIGAAIAPMLFMMNGVGPALIWFTSLTIIQLIAIRFRRYASTFALDIAKRFE